MLAKLARIFLATIVMALSCTRVDAATVVEWINLVGCRSVPTTKGLDPTVVSSYSVSNSTDRDILWTTEQAVLACDLRLPPEATWLQSVDLEYGDGGDALLSPLKVSVHLLELVWHLISPNAPSRAIAEIGQCQITAFTGTNKIQYCVATTNKSLVPFREMVSFSDGRKFPVGPLHNSFSVHARVYIPYSYSNAGESQVSTSVDRLRVIYRKP